MERYRPAAVDSLGYGGSWLEHGKTGVSAGLHSFSAVLLLSGQCTSPVGSSIPLNNLCVCMLETRSHYVAQAGLNLVTSPLACAV